MDDTTYSGLDLKLLRVGARVKQHQVAGVMGVSPSRVAAIEREGQVSDEAARRYLDALNTCSTPARGKVA